MEYKGYIKELLEKFSLEGENSIAFSVYDGMQVTDITYHQFYYDILNAAGYFNYRKIKKQHIAIVASNSYNWIVVFFAVISSGNTAVLLNPALPNDILLHQCKKADVTIACIDGNDFCNLRSSFPREVQLLPLQCITSTEPMKMGEVYSESENEPVFLMFTSGTTGTSKAVQTTSFNIRCSIGNLDEMFSISGSDRLFSGFPLYHIAGLRCVIGILQRCKTICIGRDIKYLMMDIPKLNPTAIAGVPVIAESISKCFKNAKTPQEIQRFVGTKLQRIIIGGAAPKAESLQSIRDHGISTEIVYAMTETTGDATWCVLTDDHVNSVGKPCGEMKCHIQDGEILIKGPSVMNGYYKDPEETAKVLKEGWLHTGDLGFFDERGYLYITGRKKNVIILSNGENVNPEEIEAQFSKCPEILECLVYGDKKGICADVYTINESAASDFIKKYNEAVPLYRQVYKVYYSSAPLEKTGSGKIKRKENVYV